MRRLLQTQPKNFLTTFANLCNSMNKINYQKELDRVIDKITGEGKVPKLLLHVCCAPCSSYCLEYLSKYFDITVYFYNPNISIADEYNYRLSEEKRLVSLMPFEHPVKVVEGEYLPKDYFEYVKGLENEPEGGKRCEKCFRLRLESSARYAKEHGFDYFTTTLTISPLKNAQYRFFIAQTIQFHESYIKNAVFRQISKIITKLSDFTNSLQFIDNPMTLV